MEKWKRILVAEKEICVSNYGRLKRVMADGREVEMNQYLNGGGYLICCINKKQYLTHRLVAKAFLDVNLEPQNKRVPNDGLMKKFVEHINCDKTDNRLSNLRIVTQKENCNNLTSRNAYKKSNSRFKFGTKKIIATNVSDTDNDCDTMEFYNWNDIANFLNETKDRVRASIWYAIRDNRPYNGYLWRKVKDDTYVPKAKTKYYWRKKEREMTNSVTIENTCKNTDETSVMIIGFSGDMLTIVNAEKGTLQAEQEPLLQEIYNNTNQQEIY